MIGRGFRRGKATEEEVDLKGFDAFELRLGDMMRGERATMGKSLLDVQRELKIKAGYIAAIENCDPTAFDTPGFIAGYVRSYARYLNMDPDWAFETFCAESGFRTAHGMSSAASSLKPTREERLAESGLGRDIFNSSATPFIPDGDRLFSAIEPRAVASIAVLCAVIGGLGYGGWAVLKEVQRVTFAPVDQTPVVVTEVDPLAGASRPAMPQGAPLRAETAMATPAPDVLDRLYRPQALDVPVMVARDGPISTLNPDAVAAPQGGMAPGIDTAAFAPGATPADPLADTVAEAQPAEAPLGIQVTEDVPQLAMVAVRPAWVRVRSADGTTLFEKIMDAGESWEIPATEDPATLRVGESGAIYFAVNGVHYGPAGPRGTVTGNLALSVDNLTGSYEVADLTQDADLAQIVRVAEVQGAAATDTDR